MGGAEEDARARAHTCSAESAGLRGESIALRGETSELALAPAADGAREFEQAELEFSVGTHAEAVLPARIAGTRCASNTHLFFGCKEMARRVCGSLKAVLHALHSQRNQQGEEVLSTSVCEACDVA